MGTIIGVLFTLLTVIFGSFFHLSNSIDDLKKEMKTIVKTAKDQDNIAVSQAHKKK